MDKRNKELIEAKIQLHRAADRKHHDLMNRANLKARSADENGDLAARDKWIAVSKNHANKVLYHQEKEYKLKQKLKKI